MLSNLKPLVVVLFFALAVFHVARPFCLRFMTVEAFVRRRNAWIGLTIVAFLSPEFWIFAACEIVVLSWLVRREENLLALFAVVTFVVPNVRFYLPTVLVNQLFDLTQYRILSLVLLFAAANRVLRRSPGWAPPNLGIVDVLMLGFILIQVVLPMPYESGTNTLRRAFLLLIDTYLVIYTFQRLATKEKIVEVMACYWLSIAIMAPIAIFETAKGWLLYTGLNSVWGDPNEFSWLFRGGALRAQAAAGHSIGLGYQLAAALGFFLFLWRPSVSAKFAWSVIAVFSAALFATGSRGAWVMAMIVAALYVGFRPNAGRRLAGTAIGCGIVLGLAYISPLKETVIDRLPVIGTADQETIEYRRQLFEVSWQLIKQNPFFGDPFVATRMESLRQGQGIIDIVNGYVFVALFNGIVALAFLMLAFATALTRTFVARRLARSDEEMASLGVALLSTLVGTLFFVATAGFSTTHYIVLGLLCSYWHVFRGSTQAALEVFGNPRAAMNLRRTSQI